MADLDEISMMLGEIRSDVKHSRAWQDEHEIRDQERFQQLTVRIDAANGYAGRLNSIEASIADFSPSIELVKRAKWVVFGLLLAGIVIGGTFGTAARELVKLFI